MKKVLILSPIFPIIFMLYSCNLFSSVRIESNGQPIKTDRAVEGMTMESNSQEIIDHSQWDKLLKKHVNAEGLVDYKGFQKDKAELESYLKMLSENGPNKDWSVQELLAYYINIYNAGTVKLIIENYPINSIKDINRPWSKARIQVGDKMLSLGGIENGILRKMNEPRIHFAINCASFSCPKLVAEAYTANKINEQLERATKEFINSKENEISPRESKLSSIFDWYKKDFQVNGKTDVIGFINYYSNIKINRTAKISYLNYDWNLNE